MTNLSAERVGRQLIELENQLDQMLANVAKLNVSMMNANSELELPAHSAQRALIKASEAHRKLLDVRSDLIRTHAELRKISEERDDLWTGDCPPAEGKIDLDLAA